MNSIATVAPEPVFLPFASLAWFKRQLAPTPERGRRTAIMVGAAVLCVIISMTLQVPELSVTAYMVFFVSKESKSLTTVTGVIGLVGLTIGIGITLLLYKFTYGHPELRIPGMAIAIFLGMWLSRVFVPGPLGFLIGFIVAVSQSVEFVVSAGCDGSTCTFAETENPFCVRRVHQSRTRALRAQSHLRSDVLLYLLFGD